MSIHDSEEDALLRIRGMTIVRPGGTPLFNEVDLLLDVGEVLVLLGPSGAGKSTLMAALHDRDSLETQGFRVSVVDESISGKIGVVPQRGALFDHLSVAGNLALALRNSEDDAGASSRPSTELIGSWLKSLDLPESWRDGGEGRHLSGGEAQRVAVARTLANGRRILFLDEPSVGLDPHRVRLLAQVVRKELGEIGAGALVVTHDLVFAAAFADRFVYLDREAGGLVTLDVPTQIPQSEAEIEHRHAQLSALVVPRLARDEAKAAAAGQAPKGKSRGRGASGVLGGFVVAGEVALRLVGRQGIFSAHTRDFFEVATVVVKQSLIRPAGFFAIVSLLIGYTLLYIFHRSIGGDGMPVRPDRVFNLIGSMHIIALAPALSGILFAASSASAVTAWLGGMSLTRQITALRGLGIEEARYLWAPAFLVMVLAYLLLAGLFVVGMVAGGTLYLHWNVPEIEAAFELVTADLVDPLPSRVAFRTRALVLLGLYAVGIAADAIAKGSREKTTSEAVTVAMVRSVMACTLWIVGLELVSLLLLYSVQ